MATGKKFTERESLEQVYMYVVRNWATDAGEIADGLDRSVGAVNTLLKKLATARLVEGTHVNNERKLTWQSYYDVENEDGAEALAARDFAEAFPGEPETKATHKGGGGPRYTPEQIAKGVKLTVEGGTAKAVAAAVGVRSPNYFRKVVKAEIERAAAAIKKDAKKRGGASGRKSTRVADRVVKRVRKADGDGPQELKNLLT